MRDVFPTSDRAREPYMPMPAQDGPPSDSRFPERLMAHGRGRNGVRLRDAIGPFELRASPNGALLTEARTRRRDLERT